MQETWVPILGLRLPWRKEMATTQIHGGEPGRHESDHFLVTKPPANTLFNLIPTREMTTHGHVDGQRQTIIFFVGVRCSTVLQSESKIEESIRT